MRTKLVIAAAVLGALSALAPARAGEAGRGRTSASPRPVATAEAMPPADAPETTGSTDRAEPARKPVAAWCAGGRIVGSGAGFCLVN